MTEDWLGRWREGRTGWHEKHGNALLKRHWPKLAAGSRVLVPLCGKAPDLLWLAARDLNVIGVEISDIAVRAFFDESGLEFTRAAGNGLDRYTAADASIDIYCGDYFAFETSPCDALYDRGAIVAIEKTHRAEYVAHTKRLLKPDAARLVITLEYDQSVVDGPPYAVLAEEIRGYWDDLERVAERDDLETCPPKFRKAGLQEIREVAWLGR